MKSFLPVARTALLCSAAMLLGGQAYAQSLAGPKPPVIQTGKDAGCIGELSLDGVPGSPLVADGTSTPPTWSIQSVYDTPAVCAFPSARPVQVNCRRNGVNVDPMYCQDSQFRELMKQGYRTVGNSTNWSTAEWVLPGQTDSGCIAEWQTKDGSTPQGCGDVEVPVTSTCVVTNVQSGTPDRPEQYCRSERPAAVKTVKDYRACGFTISTGEWGPYSNTCGTVSHDRPLTCVRSDNTAMDMSDPNCASALQTFCRSSGHFCVDVNGVVMDREMVQLAACSSDTETEYFWQTGSWVSSGTTCGTDTQTRSVACVNRKTGTVADDSLCSGQDRPASSQDLVVDISCGKTSVCTGQNALENWSDASNFGSYAAQCRTAGGDCVEQVTSRTTDGAGQTQTSYLSTCYGGGGNTPVGSIGPGDGPFTVHGVDVTYGSDGYCDYSQGETGNRKCVKGAYPATGCSSGIPTVTLSMPGKVRSGRGFVSAAGSFGNADGSNGIEGAECKATSTITNNGETKTLEALGTFNSSSCIGSASDTIGGTMYNVEVNVQVTQTGTGYDLSGTATAEGVGCGSVAPPTPSPTPTPAGACYAAWGFGGFGPDDPYRDTVQITEDKIWTSNDPTWYVWAPGTYSTYYAFKMARELKSSTEGMAIAVPPGARLEIYSGPDLSGTKLMDVVGPKIIQKSGVTGRFTSSWLTDDWSYMPLMGKYAPSSRVDQGIASKPLMNSYQSSFKISCGPEPTPTPSPTTSPTPTGGACVLSGADATAASSQYQECVRDMYSAGEAPLAFTLRNDDGSYTFCQSNQLIETQMCGANTLMWTGQGVCNRQYSSCSATPTPTPTATSTQNSCDNDIVGYEDLAANGTQQRFIRAYNASGRIVTTYGSVGAKPLSEYKGCEGEGFTTETGADADYVTAFNFQYERMAARSNAELAGLGGKPSCFVVRDARQNMSGSMPRDYDFTARYFAKPEGSEGVCTSTPTPTPTGTGTPTPDPTPTPTSTTPDLVTVGYCTYTSSGGGRHACGEWGEGARYNNQPVPGPKDFCTGNLIAGYTASYIVGQSTSPPDPLGTDWSDESSYHWGTPPKIRDVPGAKCVFSWKTGYSGEWKNDQPYWVSAYFDGAPTGRQGQTWIKK